MAHTIIESMACFAVNSLSFIAVRKGIDFIILLFDDNFQVRRSLLCGKRIHLRLLDEFFDAFLTNNGLRRTAIKLAKYDSLYLVR